MSHLELAGLSGHKNRSAITGQYVTWLTVMMNPNTTVTEKAKKENSETRKKTWVRVKRK